MIKNDPLFFSVSAYSYTVKLPWQLGPAELLLPLTAAYSYIDNFISCLCNLLLPLPTYLDLHLSYQDLFCMQHQCGQNAALVHTDKTERSVLLIKLETNLWDLFAVLVKVKMLTRLTLTMEKYHAVLVWSISCYPIIGTRMQQ